jgi:hypothetical protein
MSAGASRRPESTPVPTGGATNATNGMLRLGPLGVPANGGSEGWPVGLANLNGDVRQQASLATLLAHSLENAHAPVV